MTCNKCKGSGLIIKNPCEPCRGSGIATVKTEENVTIPPGINTGQNLRMTAKVTKKHKQKQPIKKIE
jgi:molecular chaperone DnaJ